MTDIILRRWSGTDFSLADFYLARCRRILPALLVLCMAVLIIGWFRGSAHEYQRIGQQVWSSASFFSNHFFLTQSSYFDKSAESGKWLQHTWSLSVEWQFYLVYPLLVIALLKIAGMRGLRMGLLVTACVSFGYSLLLYYQSQHNAAFFLMPARLWEFVAGGLAYLYAPQFTWRARSARVVEAVGLLLLLISFISIPGNQWPSAYTLLPVGGTILLLIAAREDSLWAANPLIQGLGTISYSLYLWHWPIAYHLCIESVLDNPVVMASAVALMLLLSFISWRWVERPFQHMAGARRVTVSRGVLLGCFVTATLMVSMAGYLVTLYKGFPERRRELGLQLMEHYEAMHSQLDAYYHFECSFFDDEKFMRRESIDPSCSETVTGEVVFLWGDSHAQALSTGLRGLVEPGFTVAQVATSWCPPTSGTPYETAPVDNNCLYANEFALHEIARLKPAFVVLAQQHLHEHTDWDALAKHLHDLGAGKVILVGPMPEWEPSLPALIAHQTSWLKQLFHIGSQGLVKEIFVTDRLLHERYRKSSQLQYVSLVDLLCEGENCQTHIPGSDELLVLDYGHLTPNASLYVVRAALAGILHTDNPAKSSEP